MGQVARWRWLAALLLLSWQSADAVEFRLLHSFSFADNDGARPSYECAFTQSGSTLYGVTTSGATNGRGALFRMNTDGSDFKVIHSFSGGNVGGSVNTNYDDGCFPYGSPVLTGDLIYGATGAGGSNKQGCVYVVNTSGSGFQLLHHFKFNPGTTNFDGYSPQGSLTLSDGSLFGVTANGGTNSRGMIFTLRTDGTGYRPLYTFANGGDAQYPAGSLALSGSTLYGMTQYGGSADRGTVFCINTDGSGYRILHNFGIGLDGASPLGSVIVAGSTIYGMTTRGGGATDAGTIFKQNTDGTGYQKLYSFSSPQAYSPLGALTLVGSKLYGVTSAGRGTGATGNGAGTAFEINTDGTSFKFIHNFVVPPTTTDGSYPYARLLYSGDSLYGTTYGGGAQSLGSIFSLVVGNISPTGGAVKVTINPPGAVTAGAQWQVDGGVFRNSGTVAGGLLAGTHPVAFKPVAGWITPASQDTSIILGLTNTIVATYLPADVTKPTVSVTNIPASGNVSNSSFTIRGKANDNAGVTNVLYNLNNSGWIGTTTGNGWTNWFADLVLTPGTNFIATYAVDSSGNLSVTNTVKIIYILSAPLTVSTNGRGGISPLLNGALLQIGRNYTLTATPASGFGFTNWTDGGSTIFTNKPAFTFTMAPGLSVTANFVDVTKPTVSVTNLPLSGTVSNRAFIVKGKAGDNVSVANVRYNLNNSDWLGATSDNGWTNWFAELSLTPGTNFIGTYAVDTAGNRSPTNTVKLVYILSAPLTVRTNGKGSISPQLNGALLQIGKNVTLTATPALGFVFTNWTDGGSTLITNKPVLTFLMASNLAFTANFVDVQKPVLTVLTPTAATSAGNEFYLASGKASDNAGVAAVLYQLNNLGWFLPNTTNGYTNWTVTLGLTPGTNYFYAYALDTSGNLSATNTIKFLYVTAPATLNGLAAQITPDGGTTFGTSFGATTFSQNSTDPDNANAVGSYTYTKQSPSRGLLKLTYTAPPTATNEGLQTIQLSFTSTQTARFTNDADTGGIRFTSTPTLVPASLVNQTFIAVNGTSNALRTTFAPGKYVTSNLVSHTVNTFTPATYTAYGPVGALLKYISTNRQDYTILTFTATNYGSAYTESYAGNGSFAAANRNVFGIVSQRAGGNAPNNITNRSALLFNGPDTDKFKFPDAASFTQVDSLNEASTLGAGNYVYSRTATNTANLQLNYTSPAAGTQTAVFQFIAPNFAIFTNLDATFGAAALK